MSEPQASALSQREREALAEIAKWNRSPYIWRQASMRKLEARGFVQRSGHTYGSAIGYIITAEGRKYQEASA